MILSQLILAILLVATLLVTAFGLFSSAVLVGGQRLRFVANSTACVLAVLLVGTFAFRNPSFGTDTAVYGELFQGYCERFEMQGADVSYLASIWAINGAMFGSCTVDLLPAAWLFLVAAIILCGGGRWQARLRILVALLMSMIGIALTTDALRQGLSVGVMLAALSFWLEKRRILAVLLGVASVAFHTSAALVLVAFASATLGWTIFLAILGSFAGLGFVAVQFTDGPLAALPITANLLIYAGHDSDEIIVRALAFGYVLATLSAPIIAAGSKSARRVVVGLPAYQIALRLALCCVPPLALPYFGYRFIFGVYPLILCLVISATIDRPEGDRTFGWVLFSNVAILLVWCLGSSYILSTPFLIA